MTATDAAVSAPAVGGDDVSHRLSHLWSTLATACFVVGVLAPVVGVITAVHRHAVNLPYWDEWQLVPLLEKLRVGTLRVSDLWAQHNEHRVLLPRVALLALASVSGWDVRDELYANVALAVVSLSLLCVLLGKSVGGRSGPLSVAASVMMFSMAQWENWSWGWQMSFFMNGLAATTAAVALAYWPEKRWAILAASMAGVMATLSLASGIVLLWLVPATVALCGDRHRRIDVVWTALIAGVLSALYLWGYHRPVHHPALGYDRPLDLAVYLLAYLGSPFAGSSVRSAAMFGVLGVLMLVSAACSVWRLGGAARRAATPWLFLASYVVGTGALTGLGRVGFGTTQALASRYTTLSCLFWISTLAVAVVALERYFTSSRRRGRLAMAAALASFVVLVGRGYTDSYAAGHRLFKERFDAFRRARRCVMTFRTAPDSCFDVVYHRHDVLRERLEILERLRLGPFRAA